MRRAGVDMEGACASSVLYETYSIVRRLLACREGGYPIILGMNLAIDPILRFICRTDGFYGIAAGNPHPFERVDKQ